MNCPERSFAPEKLSCPRRSHPPSLIGHCVENEAINATTLEITVGLCYPGGIAK